MSDYEEALKEYIKDIEEDTGLPFDVIRKLTLNQMRFYLQHKDEMKIQIGENGGLEYLFEDGCSRVILNENQFDDYLVKEGFKGSEIGQGDSRIY